MTIAHSVADILKEHVTLEVECIDRMYLNLCVPRLQYETGVVGFFREHRGNQFASSALMAPMTKGFVSAIENHAEIFGIPLITFSKGERKDDIAKERFARFEGEEGVVFIRKAQEKTPLLRTTKRRNPTTGRSYAWLTRSSGMVNHYYFYILDRDFGPLFIKLCSYFPYTGKVCLNGHEWAKRQLDQRGIGYTALDNGIESGVSGRWDDLNDLSQVVRVVTYVGSATASAEYDPIGEGVSARLGRRSGRIAQSVSIFARRSSSCALIGNTLRQNCESSTMPVSSD